MRLPQLAPPDTREHIGRVTTSSLRLSSWMQNQTQYGDIAFADVILGDGVSLPITLQVVEEGEEVGSFTVGLAKAKAADADPAPPVALLRRVLPPQLP